MPGGYEAYVKLLNPFRLRRGVPLWEALTRPYDEHAEEADSAAVPRVWERLTWRELLGALHLPLTPEVDEEIVTGEWPGVWPPNVGGPDEVTLPALGRVLAAFTAGACRLCYDEPGTGEPRVVFEGTLAQIMNRLGLGTGSSIVTCWPVDRAWCVAVPGHAEFTFVGGSEALVRTLLECPELEGVRVELTTGLSSGGGRR